MTLTQQAANLGVVIVGKAIRRPEVEPSSRYQYYLDEAGNVFILYRGVLTVISCDGSVY